LCVSLDILFPIQLLWPLLSIQCKYGEDPAPGSSKKKEKEKEKGWRACANGEVVVAAAAAAAVGLGLGILMVILFEGRWRSYPQRREKGRR